MFQIDQASGALSEVPGSPFAVPPISTNSLPPCQPLSLAASGQFLFVGYFYANYGDSPTNGGGNQGPSAVSSLAIDISGSSPVLLSVTTIFPQTGGSPIQLLTDPKGLHLYVGVGTSVNGMSASGPEVYSIDGTGNLLFEGRAPNPENDGFDYAIDPQDHFVFAVGGLTASHILSCIISPVDGTASSCPSLLDLSFNAVGMVVESSRHFLYIPGSSSSTAAYAIDQTTGALTQVASLPGIVLSKGISVADPMGPHIYSADLLVGGGVH